MATVHFGRLLGVVGFSKTVAIKRLHPNLAKDPEFVSMFLDEARLAARIRHPNVVSTLDVVALHGELFLVMEYVQGESLRQLVRAAAHARNPVPASIVGTVMAGTLHGLHAAHEARSERGEPLGIVHRDVSPQNILVGIDGVPRVLDFGVAKAAGRAQTTREGQLKGKLAYMSPEQLMGRGVTRSTDIFAASIVLWEALTGHRLFGGESEGEVVKRVLDAHADPPSKLVPTLPRALDAIVLRGLARDPAERFETARDMARALERALPLAPTSDVGEFVEKLAAPALALRAERIAKIESSSQALKVPSTPSLRASDASWPSLVVPAPPRPSVTTQVDTVGPPAPDPATPLPPGERSIGAIVSDSLRRAPAELDQEPTFLRVRKRVLRRVVISVAAVAGAVVLVAVGVVLRKRQEPTAAAPVATSATPAVSGPSAPAVPGTALFAPGAPSPDAAPAAEAQADLAPSTPPTTLSSGASTTPATRNRVVAPRPVPQRATAPSCDPPYTIDPNGFRRYKRECLR
jgi:eukaryotic-like serine/threonine-protein kinase